MRITYVAISLVAALLLPFGQAAGQAQKSDTHEHDSAAIVRNADGTITYGGEYRFVPPPSPWELIPGNESSRFVFGFYRKDPGKVQLESTFFAYDEEPYGYSLNIEDRSREFLKRFFWDSFVKVTVLEKKKVSVLGAEGLALTLEGKDPVAGQKVRSKVIFGKRGARVVAFYIRQWRLIDNNYDLSAFETFDRFVASLRFVHKSFYEEL
ncbi:MAG TPA: hypothetical protein VFG19_03935 [Geobacteraceae bacterium]|nr:hypothetical protein [Geobacteraceae bacterium]